MKRVTATVLFLNTALAAPALAAGYGLKEHSALAMGTAYAGVAADLSNPSGLSYNPATLAGVMGSDAAISLVEIVPHSDASFSTAVALFSAALAFAGVALGAEFSAMGDYVIHRQVKITGTGKVLEIPMKPLPLRVETDGVTVRISTSAENDNWSTFTIYRSDGIGRQTTAGGPLEVVPGVQATSDTGVGGRSRGRETREAGIIGTVGPCIRWTRGSGSLEVVMVLSRVMPVRRDDPPVADRLRHDRVKDLLDLQLAHRLQVGAFAAGARQDLAVLVCEQADGLRPACIDADDVFHAFRECVISLKPGARAPAAAARPSTR